VRAARLVYAASLASGLSGRYCFLKHKNDA
jgi:hypothetical protein